MTRVWAYVTEHFTSFLRNVELTQSQRSDAMTKVHTVGRCLHAAYYLGAYNPGNVLVVGSYGKGTAIRPPTDIDILYLLPVAEYHRINQVFGNGQSQLLQEVKRELADTFPRTDLSADGQVVLAPFESFAVEIVPTFLCNDGTYVTCHTAGGGSWRASNPKAEHNAIAVCDKACGNKATHLTKMLKAWKRTCNVPMKSIVLEIAACSFVWQWQYRQQSIFWYDWMIRDFFTFLWQYRNGTAQIPGIQETISLGDQWVSRCESAYSRAAKACEYEHIDCGILAEDEWKKIFGDQLIRAS